VNEGLQKLAEILKLEYPYPLCVAAKQSMSNEFLELYLYGGI
jgi:hypothetical protein